MVNPVDSKTTQSGLEAGSCAADSENSLTRVRPMTESDLQAVLEIERLAYVFPWSEGIFRDCLRVGYCCWVLEHHGVVQGYGIVAVGAGESHVLNLCIRPALQGQGLGRHLLMHLLQTASAHRAQSTLLEVRPSNQHAIRLYESVGFNQVGTRKNYYPGEKGREDALLFAIELDTLSPEGQRELSCAEAPGS